MEITNVQYITQIQMADTDTFVDVAPYFEITREDGSVEQAPANTDNRHYWDVKEWYETQEIKPFELTFQEMAEPVFAETIYPPEPEDTELEDEDDEPTPPVIDEPEILIPR